MKIYTVVFDFSNALDKLKNFSLKEFNNNKPTIFIEAENPDEACYLAYCKLSDILLKQSSSSESIKLINDIENNIMISKVYCK